MIFTTALGHFSYSPRTVLTGPHVETGICIKREILRRLQVMCKLFHLKGYEALSPKKFKKLNPFLTILTTQQYLDYDGWLSLPRQLSH